MKVIERDKNGRELQTNIERSIYTDRYKNFQALSTESVQNHEEHLCQYMADFRAGQEKRKISLGQKLSKGQKLNDMDRSKTQDPAIIQTF